MASKSRASSSQAPAVAGFGSKGYKPLPLSIVGEPTLTSPTQPKKQRAPRKKAAATGAASQPSAGMSGSQRAYAMLHAAQRQAGSGASPATPRSAPRSSGGSGGSSAVLARMAQRGPLDDGADQSPAQRKSQTAGQIRAPLSADSNVSNASPVILNAKHALAMDDEARTRRANERLAREEADAARAQAVAAGAPRGLLESSVKDGSAFDSLVNQGYYKGPRPPLPSTSYTSNSSLSLSNSYTASASRLASLVRSRPGTYSSRIDQHFRPVHSSSSWWGSYSTPSFTGGFRNVGNSCYMNAVLQALLGLPSFNHDVTSTLLSECKLHPPVKRSLPDDSCFRMLFNLAMERSGNDKRVIETKDIKDTFGARNRMFSGYQQQDAHEFLCECLNFIHDDVEQCLLTDNELRLREELRKRLEAPRPATKPAAARKPASTSAPADGDDPFEFKDGDADVAAPAHARPASPAASAHPPRDEAADSDVEVVERPTAAEADAPMQEESKEGAATAASAADAVDITVPAAAADAVAVTSPPPPFEPLLTPEREAEVASQLPRFSPVLRNFNCELAVQLTCLNCKRERTVLEPFHDFSLDLPSKQAPPKPASKPAAPAAAAAAPAASNGKGPLAHAAAVISTPADSGKPKPLSNEATFSFDGHDAAPAAANGASSPAPTAGKSTAAAAASSSSAMPPGALPANALYEKMAAAQAALSQVVHLEELVKNFFEPRMTEYRCECSPENQELEQRPLLSRLPRVLILHLKRFQPNMRTGTYEKRQDAVRPPSILDLTPFVADDVHLPLMEGDQQRDAATQNLAGRFDDAEPSPQKGDRKRKTPAAPSSSSSEASVRSGSPARPAKQAKRESGSGSAEQASPAAIKLKCALAKRIRTATEEHEDKCMKVKHDLCADLATALSVIEGEHEVQMRALRERGSATVPAPVSESSSDDMDDADDEVLQKALRISRQEEGMRKQELMSLEEQHVEEALRASLAEATPVAPSPSPKPMRAAAAAAAASSTAAAAPASAARASPRVQHTYELLSVVIHKGVTAGSGHYVTNLLEEEKKDSGTGASSGSASASAAGSAAAAGASANATNASSASKDTRVWKQYDDSRVMKLDAAAALKGAEKEGYIFFYSYKPTTKQDAKPRNSQRK